MREFVHSSVQLLGNYGNYRTSKHLRTMATQIRVALVALFVAVALVFAFQRGYRVSRENAATLEVSSKVLLVPFSENRCEWRYNYVCKFFYHVRCNVFGAFQNFSLRFSVEDVVKEASDNDVVVLVWRGKSRSEVPRGMEELLAWRDSQAPGVRIGVLHIANEVNRTKWSWYSRPDFVLRNYWVPRPPLHVLYLPLPAQFPDDCHPNRSDDVSTTSGFPKACSCQNENLKRASHRKFLWSFAGSVRRNRSNLLGRIHKWRLRDRGSIVVAGNFGGDGDFAAKDGTTNPKYNFLRSLADTQFAFAPCGNVMETHRIYEALVMGAIPVVEKCEDETAAFFPFHEVVVSGGPKAMLRFVDRYATSPSAVDALQKRVLRWWHGYQAQIPQDVLRTTLRNVPATQRYAI